MAASVHLPLHRSPKASTSPRSVWLIKPPTLVAPRSLSYFGSVPSLGLAYVAAAVREAGHDVHVIDAPGEAYANTWPFHTAAGNLLGQGLSIDAVAERLPVDAAFVGISHMFLHEWGLIRMLIAAIRRRAPSALIVAGGENASAYWETMLRECEDLDLCVRGEGEATMVEVVEAVTLGRPLEEVPGIALRVDGVPRCTSRRTRLQELDAWPTPAWDLFSLEPYLRNRGHGGVARGRSLPITTTRGCPYQCTFCSSPSMWTTRYERRDPARVVDEIEHLVARYGINNVDLQDLTALLTKRWLIELCDELTRRGVGVTWQMPSGTRSEAIDAEAAARLHASGCRNIGYAPESGSAELLSRIKKRVNLPALLTSLRGSVAAGLKTEANIIIGFPHETSGDLLRTVGFIVALARGGLHSLSVMVFAPYPGSEEFRRLAEAGRIEFDERYLYGSLLRSAGGLRSYHPTLGPRELLATQLGLLLLFFGLQYGLRPWRLIELVIHTATGREETVVDQFFGNKLRQLRSALIRRARRWAPSALRWGRGGLTTG